MKKTLFFLIVGLAFAAASPSNAQNNLYGNSANSPRLYAPNGQFLGNVNSNRYDPDSISNPYGQYGSRYAPNSINNPYGRYGSPYSPDSVNNRFGR